MSESRRGVPDPRPAPSRIPGEGGIELEPMSGDLQLRQPQGLGWARPKGQKVATEQQREKIYRPGSKAPVSGVYNLVDEHGEYLKLQVTCHAGEPFPPPPGPEILISQHGKTPFGYMLAYEAAHLRRAGERAEPQTIYRPGELVPTSGIYGVVDSHGNYLQYQRACVHEEHAPEHERERFPPTDAADPAAYGYVLQYEAQHLRAD